VEFARLQLPDGREFPAHTAAAAGLNSIYIEPPAKTEQNKARQR
jgi:hypothetical protein